MEHLDEGRHSSEHSAEDLAYQEFIEAMNQESQLFQEIDRAMESARSQGQERQLQIAEIIQQFEKAQQESHEAFARWWKKVRKSQEEY